MTDWTDQLQTLNAEPLYPAEADATRNAQIGIDADLKHISRPERRRLLHMLAVSNAAKALDRLPEPRETFHVVMSGNFNAWDIVPAVLTLAAPATIAELNVATLGFNEQNATELIGLLDAGQVGRCTFICSVYYKSMKDGAPVYDALAEALTNRGHQIAAIRCHAKILGMELTDGRCLTVESSANLRSCRNIEQFTLSHDADLLHFHREWMMELLRHGSTL
jgi:hypothetical protein